MTTQRTVIYWGGVAVYDTGVIAYTGSFPSHVTIGIYTYIKGSGSYSPYPVSRSHQVSHSTSGGAGGSGGGGQGSDGSRESGSAGSLGGTNAGRGGTGGTGGTFGNSGSTGGTGASGNAGAGSAGTSGGDSGYAIQNKSLVTLTNNGTVLGRQG